MTLTLMDAIGFTAGLIVTTAALPRVIDIIRNRDAALGESYARNAMLVTGNLVWVVYGVAAGVVPLTVMCVLTAALNGAILLATALARRRRRALVREAELNHQLALYHPGRRFVPVAGSRWGELILPAPEETTTAHAGTLRVVLFASFEFGYLAVEAVKAYARRFPDRVQIVGLVTDDPMNTEARIGLKKRLWKLLARDEIVAIETAVVEAALTVGVPVHTGEVKIDGFRSLLESWKPDAIVSCVFGQVIDRPIIERPAYGIYNFHPSDLAHGFGAGPTPAEDLAVRGATSTVWTIHQVSEEIDSGAIVAVSPRINVADDTGKLPAESLVVYDKLCEPVGCLAACLVDALWRRREAGQSGRLTALDVKAAFPAAMLARMQEPIRAASHTTALPVFEPAHLEVFR